MSKNYYDILGIDKNNTSIDEIKKKYREIAKKFHPDKNPGNKEAEAKFREATEAYEILKDPHKKQRYDMFGDNSTNFGKRQSTHTNHSTDTFYSYEFFKGTIFDHIFKNMSGFGGFDTSTNKRDTLKKGEDIKLYLSVSFKEVYYGTKKEIKYGRLLNCKKCNGLGGTYKTCFKCKGSGYLKNNDIFPTPCVACAGKGKIIESKCNICSGLGRCKEYETINIRIPKGVSENDRVKARHMGNEGLNGGEPGDLYLVIKIIPHEFLEKDGFNIIYNCPLKISEAVLGTEKIIDFFDKKIKLKIKAGTEHGQLLKIPEQGINNEKLGINGDLIIKVTIKIPRLLTQKQKELFEKLRDIEDE